MTEGTLVFGGFNESSSPFAVVGVPLETETSFREGSKWAPLEIRKASNFIEFRAELGGFDVDAIGFEDVGDVPVLLGNKKKALEIIEEELRKIRKIPIVLGGEHTITYATVRALEPDCLLVFDAHLDSRDEYSGDKWSHACWLRRLLENLDLKVAVVGARAYVDEEVEFLRRRDVIFSKRLTGFLYRFFGDCKNIYVSLDMDYFEPGLVPGVSNPEPGGASFEDFLEHIKEVRNIKLVGMDVVELAPPYDRGGVSAVYAARSIVEAISVWRLPSPALPDRR